MFTGYVLVVSLIIWPGNVLDVSRICPGYFLIISCPGALVDESWITCVEKVSWMCREGVLDVS